MLKQILLILLLAPTLIHAMEINHYNDDLDSDIMVFHNPTTNIIWAEVNRMKDLPWSNREDAIESECVFTKVSKDLTSGEFTITVDVHRYTKIYVNDQRKILCSKGKANPLEVERMKKKITVFEQERNSKLNYS